MPEALLTCVAFSRQVPETVVRLTPVLVTVLGHPSSTGNLIEGPGISSRKNFLVSSIMLDLEHGGEERGSCDRTQMGKGTATDVKIHTMNSYEILRRTL